MDYLSRIEKQLDLAPAEKEQVMRELRSHYEELKEELVASGMDPKQAEEEAARRMGTPDEVAASRGTVPGTSSWKSALLATVPFIAAIPVLPLDIGKSVSHEAQVLRILYLAIYCAIMAGGTIRELRHDRRPVWLATWSAASIVCATAVVRPVLSFLMPGTRVVPNLVSYAITWTIMTCIGLLSSRGAPKWAQVVVVGQMLSLLALAGMSTSWGIVMPAGTGALVGAVYFIPGSVAWVVIALRLLALHRFGNVFLASLFLFVATASQLGGYVYASSLSAITRADLFVPVLVAAVAVILFARAPTSRLKLMALAAGVVVQQFWRLSYVYVDLQLILFWTVQAVESLILVVLVPVLFERWMRGQSDRPEIVA